MIAMVDGRWHVITANSDDIFDTEIQARYYDFTGERLNSAAEAAKELQAMSAKTDALQKLQVISRQMYELQQSYFATVSLARMAGWLAVTEAGAITADLTDAEAAALGKDAATTGAGITAQMTALSSVGSEDSTKIVQFAY
jgi:hypothetical protein